MNNTSAVEVIIHALCPGPAAISDFGALLVMYASKSATRAASSAGEGVAELAGVCAHANIGVRNARAAPPHDETIFRIVDLACLTSVFFLRSAVTFPQRSIELWDTPIDSGFAFLDYFGAMSERFCVSVRISCDFGQFARARFVSGRFCEVRISGDNQLSRRPIWTVRHCTGNRQFIEENFVAAAAAA
jgi:hypothetical protein